MGITRAFGEQYRKPTGRFGRLIGKQMNRHHVELVQWAMASMDVKADDTILDLGCGAGMAIGFLTKAVFDGKIVGIDYSNDMIRVATDYNAAAVAAGRVVIRNADISSLPFDEESFDKAWSIESFYYWPDYEKDLTGIAKVLKDGGRLVIVLEWSRNMSNIKTVSKLAEKMNCPLHSGDEISNLLTHAGFVDIDVEFRPDKNWLLVIGYKKA